MDWARDHLGNDIPAWRGGIPAYGLVCPSCGEPVRRRAGSERRPHFAHFSHRAKPECENYFPSSGYQIDLGNARGFGAHEEQANRNSLNCGLFLGASGEGNTLKLWLRVPSVEPSLVRTGSVQIQSGLGLRVYEASALSSARLVPLRPQVPLGSCIGSGDLLSLAARVATELAAFVHDHNLFYADERSGRLVFPGEPLEWGARYRLLSSTEVDPPTHLYSMLDWRVGPMLAEWHVYSFSFPTAYVASEQDVPTQIAEFLGRKIRSARPRLFIVDPPPHHIDFDGTYVYPMAPSSILMRRNASKRVVAVGSPERERYVVTELSDEWVRLEQVPTGGGDCIVSIDGIEQVVLRIEPCGLFRPRGVVAHCSEHSWDLTSEAPIDRVDLRRHEVSVECDNDRVAAYIARLNPDWNHDRLILSLPADAEKVLRAGSFGQLLAVEGHASSIGGEASAGSIGDTQNSAAKVWIEGLVAATFGEEGLGRVRKYLADPDRSNVCHLGPLMSSHLMPYIRAAHDREHEI